MGVLILLLVTKIPSKFENLASSSPANFELTTWKSDSSFASDEALHHPGVCTLSRQGGGLQVSMRRSLYLCNALGHKFGTFLSMILDEKELLFMRFLTTVDEKPVVSGSAVFSPELTGNDRSTRYTSSILASFSKSGGRFRMELYDQLAEAKP